MQLKNLFYDWFGYNEIIFNQIHNAFSNISILKILRFLSDYIGEDHMFPMHFLIILISIHTYILYKGYRNNLEIQLKFIKIIFIMLFSIITGAMIVYIVKYIYAFTRPYCLKSFHINPIIKALNPLDLKQCYKGFPSGHAWYITTMVLSLWTIMNPTTRVLGITLILLIGLTRVVFGRHFPADVLYGYIIAIVIVLIAHIIADKFTTTMRDRLKNLSKIIY